MKYLSGLNINLVVFFTWFYLINFSVQGQKNDTVYLMNGDRITGEFKKYDFGILSLKTDGMGTLSIEYDKIKTVYSAKNYDIVDLTGFNLYGSLMKSDEPGMVGIIVSNDTIYKPVWEIVQVFPVKNIFWRRFSGSIDLGASYYKSTEIVQFNFSTSIQYRSKSRLIVMDLSSIFSDEQNDDNGESSRKTDMSLEIQQFFKGKWWGGAGIKAQQNYELNLDYRLQAALIGGYDLVHSNPVWFYAIAGFAGNQEKAVDSTDVTSSLEGIIGLKFTWIQYKHPKINISASFNFSPSFTVSGRYRFESNLSARYELFKDFYLGLTFYDSYDSKPVGGGSSLNDWGTSLSIGYSF